jgi:hypothetical protein
MQQVAGRGDLEIGFLRGRIAVGFLELRLDRTGAVLLLDAKGLGGDTLPFDEDSEGAGVHGLSTGRLFLFVAFVPTTGRNGGHEQSCPKQSG